MALTLLGTKLGMTRWFTEAGANVPATVIRVGPCVVTQLKRPETDGYAAVQIGYEDVKPRRSTVPMIGHDAKAGAPPKRHHREFRVEPEELDNYELGQELTAAELQNLAFVDVSGTSKGKGFQGVMKRHNFRGQQASHGVERKHRAPGAIAGGGIDLGAGPKLKKGKRMPGQMGAKRSTVRSLEVVKVIPEEGLALVRGPVPGPNKGLVEIRPAKRLFKSKAQKQAEAQAAG